MEVASTIVLNSLKLALQHRPFNDF